MNEAINTPAPEEFVPHKDAITDRTLWDKKMEASRVFTRACCAIVVFIASIIGFSFYIKALAFLPALAFGYFAFVLADRYMVYMSSDKAFEYQLRNGPAVTNPTESYVHKNRTNLSSVHCSYGYFNIASPNSRYQRNMHR